MMHTPVLLQAAVDAVVVNPNGVYLDATFGRGGHSRKILSKLSDQGRLIAFDKDPEAVTCGLDLQKEDGRFEIVHCDFADGVQTFGFEAASLDGALFDLGMSSPQLDNAGRGFSFQSEGPLDMRMDTTSGLTLAQWFEQVDESEMIRVLREYGEERYARSIARAIIANRPVTTTTELAEIIAAARPYAGKKHPATRSFQAFRICINKELAVLSQALESVIGLIRAGGRLAVISFHSLEDRIVKRCIAGKLGTRAAPSVPTMDWLIQPVLASLGKTKPSADEVSVNPRARSAVMRIAEKLHVDAGHGLACTTPVS